VNKKFLEIWNLEKTFPSQAGPVAVVKGFDLKVAEGEFVSVIGHSGCGKSTVLSIIAGLTPSSGGVVVLAGREVREAGPDRGVVFQAPCLLHWLTALENVALGVEQVHPKKTRKAQRDIAAHALTLVGLGDALHKLPAELSSGMRQRVGLARAFALSPKLLLLDEPFGMLDSLTRIDLQEVLLELWAQDQKTAFMVTHDVDEALLLSDRVIMMTSGPEAHVGDILTVPLPRPRDRVRLMDDPQYLALRDHLIGFLEAGHQSAGNGRKPSPDEEVSLGKEGNSSPVTAPPALAS
jgi:nitrate/nitrite transport system ATP-binding protein